MHSDTLQASPTLGRVLKGQYRVENEIGSGAMGMVFRGTHIGLGKPVAIKMLRPDGFNSREAQERFQREAKTASMLVHPGIAQVFDYGIEDGMPFLVMEFVDGKELAQVILDEGPMTPARAVAIVRQLASVLEEAHRQGVVHRDIKPQNLKLMRYTPGGQIFLKVLDFGIAKQVGQDQAQGRLTATGAVMGTPIYMAPEQASGTAKGIDGRADLYATGIVFYELLTGTAPFDGPSLAGVLISHLTQPPPPLPRTVPEPVRQVVARLLKKQPEDRFPDAGALDRALQACEAACRDVPALPKDSIKPAVAQGSHGPASWTGRAGLVLGAMVVAGATMFGVLKLGPRLNPGQIQQTQQGPGPQIGPGPGPGPGKTPTPPQKQVPGVPVDPVKPVDTVKPPVEPVNQHPVNPPPNSDAEKDDRPVKDVPESREVKTKLNEVETLIANASYAEAVTKAQQALRVQDPAPSRAHRLLTIAYCGQGDLGAVNGALFGVPRSQRALVRRRCSKLGMEIP